MKPLSNRQLIIIAVICLGLLAAGLLFLLGWQKEKKTNIPEIKTEEPVSGSEPVTETGATAPRLGSLGLSVQGRSIDSYAFGTGETELVFIGGIHGGYEWNSVLLAYKFIDYLESNPESIPADLTITVVPAANPDGVFKITGKEARFTAADIPAGGSNEDGRLNAAAVDLNRNFACNWKADGVWKNKAVSGGTAPFSEPESAAIRDYILKNEPAAVVFWHSQSNAIYGSQCGGDMLPETAAIMNAYSAASGYRTVTTFDQYAVTGDVTDWLASIGVPAMTVELKTHETIEWEQNLAGIKALFEYYETKEEGYLDACPLAASLPFGHFF